MLNIISLEKLESYKNKKLKIGIFGGSFDPPHNGHLNLAQNALEKLSLDEVWFDLANQNPTKPTHHHNFEERSHMVQNMIASFNKMKLLIIEKELEIILTIDLISYLKKLLPKIEFYFLIGADLASSIHKWEGIDKIIDSLKLVIFSRSNYSHEVKNSYIYKKYNPTGKVEFIEIEEIDVSSTEIRKILKEKK